MEMVLGNRWVVFIQEIDEINLILSNMWKGLGDGNYLWVKDIVGMMLSDVV